MDVKKQQLVRGVGFEVVQHLSMVLIPVLKPAPFELPPGVNTFVSKGAKVGSGELALVVLQT